MWHHMACLLKRKFRDEGLLAQHAERNDVALQWFLIAGSVTCSVLRTDTGPYCTVRDENTKLHGT